MWFNLYFIGLYCAKCWTLCWIWRNWVFAHLLTYNTSTKKNLLQSYSPSWNDYNHFLNFMCDIEIVYLARNTPFILTETLYQWIFVFLILCICIVLSNEIPHLFWQKHCTNELFLYVASLAFVCYELSLRYQQTRIK